MNDEHCQLQWKDISISSNANVHLCLTCLFLQKVLMDSQLGKDGFARILRSHIVMCHTLLPVDLSRPRNLTSLSGLVLTTSSSQVTILNFEVQVNLIWIEHRMDWLTDCLQGKLVINQANVTYSDDVSINGIFHVIDKILVPLDVNTSVDVVVRTFVGSSPLMLSDWSCDPKSLSPPPLCWHSWTWQMWPNVTAIKPSTNFWR